jgi:hypothetical protein
VTFAEVLLLVGGGVGIYRLLRPFQRWLERTLRRTLSGRHSRALPPPIDVTDFTPRSRRKDDRQT